MAPVAIAFNCQMLTVEALPSGWALPPARRQSGLPGEAGSPPRNSMQGGNGPPSPLHRFYQ